jgi:ubiquinone/menaquinone biosynthesis C-methylase UbiE
MDAIAESCESEVISYFKNKAAKYDLVDNQIYWVFSDALLWYLLKERILSKLSESFHFLDAGGGTGRWTLKILESFPQSTAVIYDLSEDMTKEALKKAKVLKLSDRLTIINGNLNNVNQHFKNEKFDLIYNFHNVLGFVENPSLIIKNLTALLNTNALLISMVPNKYHNIFFNIATNSVSEAKNAANKNMGKFTQNMPTINLFTPESIKKIYLENKLIINSITGFPNFIYPGYQETQLEGSTTTLNDVLSANYDEIYAIEKAYLDAEDIAARGNNILIVGHKTN